MILADKIIALRKKAGWSQEDLAEQLNVTRQSVSKWEGAQSVPDMDKIVQMSRLFGVTTDYLLKDEIEESPAAPQVNNAEKNKVRRITMEQASTYLSLRKSAAPKVALATLLCILSPIALILFAGLSDSGKLALSEEAAAGIGLCALFLLVAAGVSIFIYCASKVSEFEFLEKEAFETEYGVTGMIRERREAYKSTYTRLNIIGTVLCILSVIPLFAAMAFSLEDMVCLYAVCCLFAIVGVGTYMFVYAGVYQSAMNKLLEEDDYTRENKASTGIIGAVSTAYWLVVVAVYMFFSFGPFENGRYQGYWFIWPIAGVLYAALVAVLKAVRGGKGK